MTLTDTQILSSTVEGTCPICEGQIPERGIHSCFGNTKVIDYKHFPTSKEDEILTVLKDIKELLEKIYMDI